MGFKVSGDRNGSSPLATQAGEQQKAEADRGQLCACMLSRVWL